MSKDDDVVKERIKYFNRFCKEISRRQYLYYSTEF